MGGVSIAYFIPIIIMVAAYVLSMIFSFINFRFGSIFFALGTICVLVMVAGGLIIFCMLNDALPGNTYLYYIIASVVMFIPSALVLGSQVAKKYEKK